MRTHLAALAVSSLALAVVLVSLAPRTAAQDKVTMKVADLAGHKVTVAFVTGSELYEYQLDSVETLGIWTNKTFIPWTAIKSVHIER